MLNQVILFHPIEFTCKLLSGVLEPKEVKTYFLTVFEEFAYLVDDLRPQLIIVHESFLNEGQASFEAELTKANFKAFKLIYITQAEIEEPFILEPIEPMSFYEQVIKFLA